MLSYTTYNDFIYSISAGGTPNAGVFNHNQETSDARLRTKLD